MCIFSNAKFKYLFCPFNICGSPSFVLSYMFLRPLLSMLSKQQKLLLAQLVRDHKMIVLAPFSSTVTKTATRQWSSSFYRWNWQWQGRLTKNATQAGSLKNKRPRKIRREALPSVRKAKGISSTAHNKAADPEDDILRLRKRKLQLENIELRLEIKRLRKDLDN